MSERKRLSQDERGTVPEISLPEGFQGVPVRVAWETSLVGGHVHTARVVVCRFPSGEEEPYLYFSEVGGPNEGGRLIAISTAVHAILNIGRMEIFQIEGREAPPAHDTDEVFVLREQVAKLEAELARLKPSGQVAEDVGACESALDGYCERLCAPPQHAPRCDLARAALSRLATAAQGYEAIREALNDNYGADGDPLGRVTDLLEAEEEARSEAAVETDERHRVELERDRAAARADKAEHERDAAVADNAARKRVGAMMANACFNLAQREHLRPDERQTLDELRRAWDALGAHPGAALLEQHRKEVAHARDEGLEMAAQCSDDAAEEAEKRAESASASPNPDAATWDNGAANEARNIATRIRDLKNGPPPPGHTQPGAALLEVASLLREYQSRDEPDVLTTLKRILEERRR